MKYLQKQKTIYFYILSSDEREIHTRSVGPAETEMADWTDSRVNVGLLLLLRIEQNSRAINSYIHSCNAPT